MLEIRLFDGGMKGEELALLHSVWLDGRHGSVRSEAVEWSSTCTSAGEPGMKRSLRFPVAHRAPMHDREEVAVHA
jgi:hypothetical protein